MTNKTLSQIVADELYGPGPSLAMSSTVNKIVNYLEESGYIKNKPADQADAELLERIKETLSYYKDEFPRHTFPEIWVEPICGWAGGVTPDDLLLLNNSYDPDLRRGLISTSLEGFYLLKYVRTLIRDIEHSCCHTDHLQEFESFKKLKEVADNAN